MNENAKIPLLRQKILLTGASGFVGSRLLSTFNALLPDLHIRVAARRPFHIKQQNVEEVLIPSITEKNDWSVALSGIHTVVHLAARVHEMSDKSENEFEKYRIANALSTMNLAQQAAKFGIKRFIFISTIKVNGEKTFLGRPFTEESIPNPIDPYAISKFEAELAIREICSASGMQFVIIRPPLVYGPGVKANFLKLMNYVHRRLPLPLGGINNKRSMLALDNLIDFILLATMHPLAANQTFLISDNQSLSTPQLIKYIEEGMGYKETTLFSLPPELLKVIGFCVGQNNTIDRLTESLEVSISKAQDLLKWSPPIEIERAIQLTVSDYLISKK